mmetsp:Transcript_28472/g.82035  ORF Transcript_28472/g.82035 Transcript_28472/m.82035 type:complete len:229 (-) Transcript_28472:872-1558(-)
MVGDTAAVDPPYAAAAAAAKGWCWYTGGGPADICAACWSVPASGIRFDSPDAGEAAAAAAAEVAMPGECLAGCPSAIPPASSPAPPSCCCCCCTMMLNMCCPPARKAAMAGVLSSCCCCCCMGEWGFIIGGITGGLSRGRPAPGENGRPPAMWGRGEAAAAAAAFSCGVEGLLRVVPSCGGVWGGIMVRMRACSIRTWAISCCLCAARWSTACLNEAQLWWSRLSTTR